jgi:hypothetical protein
MRHLLFIMFFFSLTVTAQDFSEPSITIKHGACYGSCPIYTMTLFPDGAYFWVGEMYVGKEGFHRGKLTPQAFERAMQVLSDAHYLEFKNEYSEEKDGCKEVWTDNPTIVIHVQLASSTKEISHNYGCRGFNKEKELKKLEAQLGEILETKKYESKR